MNGIMGMSDLLFYSDLTQDHKEMVNLVKSSSKALFKLLTIYLIYLKLYGNVRLKYEGKNAFSQNLIIIYLMR
jgi:hypothetical protein